MGRIRVSLSGKRNGFTFSHSVRLIKLRFFRSFIGMKTTLSAKRQVSIPKRVCDELELEPGAQIAWEVQDRKLVGRPLPKEGWRSLIGKYKGGPDLVATLLKQRREDREREDRKLAR
jgi:antitoxin component of MazEF toxin-antitoxin module